MPDPDVPALPAWIADMLPPGVRRARVDVGGYRMHVMEMGAGRPVLFLHGNPTWSFLYRRVMAALAAEPLRLVAPDLVGLGFSDRPQTTSEHSIEAHARWLGALVEALGLEDLILVVQDWGGPFGVRMLADRPRLARGLVLLNTGVSPPRAGFRGSSFHRFARLPLVSDLAFRLLGFPQNALHRVQGDPASIRGEVARAYRYPLRHLSGNAAPLALARMVPDRDDHPSVPGLRVCEATVTSFAGPIALVWGTRDPILGRVVNHLERILPRARVLRTTAGHFLQEEVPDAIAGAVREVAAAIA